MLAAEACRLTNRLDKYDRILASDPTASVKSEARLTAMALQRILSSLTDVSRVAPENPEASGATTGATLADEIAARRAARQADTAG